MAKFILKPYTLVRVQADGYVYIGELMSYPTPEDTAMVRRVPGHPGTLDEIPVSRLSKPDRKYTKVHYAKVTGGRSASFPVDMLRYDFAAPINFTLVENMDRFDAVIDPSFGLDGLWIATCTPRGVQPWTPARWRSFLWALEEKHSEYITEAPL